MKSYCFTTTWMDFEGMLSEVSQREKGKYLMIYFITRCLKLDLLEAGYKMNLVWVIY